MRFDGLIFELSPFQTLVMAFWAQVRVIIFLCIELKAENREYGDEIERESIEHSTYREKHAFLKQISSLIIC